MTNFIAFKGIIYTIEWFINDISYSQALEYFENTSENEQNKIIALFRLIATMGKIWDITKFRHEGDSIYTFKTNQNRYLCFFFKQNKIIITNAYTKKSQKMPSREKQRALIAYKSYIKRIKEGTYYEEEH